MKSALMIFLCLCLASVLYGQESAIARRIAYRKSLENPATRDASILKGLRDKDPIIRKKALFEIYQTKGEQAIPELKKLVKDNDKSVRLLLLECVKDLKTPKLRTEMAQYLADNSPDDEIKRDARKMLTHFNFTRKNIRLKDDPSYDHNVIELADIVLPDDKWLIRKDVVENGHELGFFKPDLKEEGWQAVKTGAWENQCLGTYDGIAWYRIRFQAPEKGEAVGAELYFEGVDEIAWVWLNGQYIGQHDLGPAGWNIPFYLNIGAELQWGKENLLVVRVHDSTAAGGIWKAIHLKTLK